MLNRKNDGTVKMTGQLATSNPSALGMTWSKRTIDRYFETSGEKNPREKAAEQSKRLRFEDRRELINCVANRATWLIRDYDNSYFFIYRDAGLYAKTSCHYGSRTAAMERYHAGRIIWLHFIDEKKTKTAR